jgi:hypothetical protein
VLIEDRMKMFMPFYYVSIVDYYNAQKLGKYIVTLEYKGSDYQANSLKIIVKDEQYVLLNTKVQGKQVKAQFGVNGGTARYFTGYISTISPSFAEGIPSVEVFCLDESYPLSKDKKSRKWSKVKRSDVAKKIAKEHGLKIDIQETSKVIDDITQSDETDMQLLQKMAEDETQDTIGKEKKYGINQAFWIAKVSGNTLRFRRRNFDTPIIRNHYYNSYDTSLIECAPTLMTNTKTATEESSASKGGTKGSPDISEKKTETSGGPLAMTQQEKARRKQSNNRVKFNTKTGKWEVVSYASGGGRVGAR